MTYFNRNIINIKYIVHNTELKLTQIAAAAEWANVPTHAHAQLHTLTHILTYRKR